MELKVGIYAVFLCLCIFSRPVFSVRLASKSRWIVEEQSGRRVKLACINLVSHLEPMVTEGLDKQPLKYIANAIASNGFNCVRLTWATFMVTEPQNRILTVESSLRSLNLSDSVDRMSVSNPDLLNLGLLEAFQKVVQGLGDAGLMVILDNQVSKPQWCCGLNDGNSFFGAQYFDPQVWLQGLTTMASTFKDNPTVVGMSLRNELRGSLSNPSDWYKYMQAGAEAVHSANPDVLVILSGLNYDADLKFLASKPVNLGFMNKIAYELHWYSFTDGSAWERSNANRLCGSVTARINDHAGFVVRDGSNSGFKAAPLFISEFGIDQRGMNLKDNRFINCFLAFAADGDFEWALWTLQGSYYYRNGRPGFEETYGILNSRWDGLRNPGFVARLQSIQQPLQDPFSSDEASFYQMVYHPATGLCLAASDTGELKLDSCDGSSTFTYKPSDGLLGESDGSMCINAQGNGQAALFSTHCTLSNSSWQIVSSSKLQIAITFPASSLGNGTDGQMQLCLDGSSGSQVLTNECLCLTDSMCDKNEKVEMQWFKVIRSNRRRNSKT